jgi:hypothetical protein
MSLAREMPVSAVARHVEVTDKRLWRIVHYYVSKAMNGIQEVVSSILISSTT